MKLLETLFKKNLEKNPAGFEDIINKLSDSFSIRKYEVKPQVKHEDTHTQQSME